MPRDGSGEMYKKGNEKSSEESSGESSDESSEESSGESSENVLDQKNKMRFSDEICIDCKTVLPTGWLDRCEECFDPEYARLPCLKCEHQGLKTPALQGAYYCKVCREDEYKEEVAAGFVPGK